MGKEINLAYLYADILNLHGDRGNVLAFEKIAKEMGIELKTTRIDSPNEKIDFDKFDIILLSPGELKVMDTIVETFNNQRDEFEKYVNENKYMFVIGTTGAILAKNIKFEDGREKEGLNVFDMKATERKWIYGDDLTFNANIDGKDMEIISCQINSIDMTFNTDEITPFGSVNYGLGNDKNHKEGARKNNLIYTNALGPVFIKNPWLTKEILLDIANKKDIEIKNIDLDFSIEEASKETIKDFISKKEPVQ
ncbi:hypothetical protein [Anaerofustis stercorihominis]|uniref:hypothetical protein n=1 Tax=Anaerofustis stercorihominis TaxID=214853 RepID=UPI001105E0E4|nr:hypothetical protein [Anaerofustis stercorihominis]